MSFISDFTLISIQYIAVKWNSVLEHSIHLLRLLSIGDCYSRDT